MLIGSIKFDITPHYPVSLLGYFNDRVSTGVADPLHCRMLALKHDTGSMLIIHIDSCLIPTEDAEHLRKRICACTSYNPEELLICTTHTHTAPALVGFYGARAEQKYRQELYDLIVDRSQGMQPDTPCTVKHATFMAEGLSHNRRWYMSDGGVVTNPPKGSKNRIKPEGTTDDEVVLIGFFDRENHPLSLLVNISNHTDSVGGTRISADWPGALERYIEHATGLPVNTITLIAPQGNINHYDFDSPGNQTSHEEAVRLGNAYGKLVVSSLPACSPMKTNALHARLRYADVQAREISEDELERARNMVQNPESAEDGIDLKAEDLATPAVLRIFASELLAFHEKKPLSYRVPLQALQIGDVYLCAIPGEPFVEIGLRLKESVRPRTLLPVSLAGGYFGYIPLKESFDRGGYETRQGVHNCLSREAAGIIVEGLLELVDRLNGREAV
jgi:hypothetical protein